IFISDRCNIVAVILILVLDVGAIWVGNLGNLTDPVWWRIAAQVGSGMVVGIGDSVDIPVGVVTKLRGMPLEIGVTEQHLLRRTVRPGVVVLVVIADVALRVVGAVIEVSVVKSATGAVAARLCEAVLAVTAAHGNSRADGGNCSDARALFSEDCAVRSAILIVIDNGSHWPVISDVVSTL